MKRNIITIATGKQLYIDLAVNLARSFIVWHHNSDISFFIVTDNRNSIPTEILEKINIINIAPGELGEGFSSKLYLDRLAPEGQTLFIDSDCLIFENLGHLFDKFKGHSVSVVGGYIKDGEWFGDIKKICNEFRVPHIPKFNGGIYYLEKNPISQAVYQTARELELRYDAIGFVRLRNRPNDEVIMALAMQLHGQTPLIDDGTVMSDPLACQGGYQINVLSGGRYLINPPKPDPKHQEWYPFQKVSPAIVHFLGYYTNHFPYRREAYLLYHAVGGNLNFGIKLKAILTIEYPERISNTLKDLLRPLFRRFFGTREIKTSDRIV
ncbi:hypothetical protein [Desertivirga brevis]|uniref:hypothetical protein n=1 Tax=Desertivirga brevis TaxID=2810310 RepID=UPI001A95D057|nr:hypothetical protein [Pedobacter sp. SYSU D00873]